MQQNGDSRFRIQAMVRDIIVSNSLIHITVDVEPSLNVPYTILLDDGQFQCERYALFIMDELNLINLMFPNTPPELSAATLGAKSQRLDAPR